MKNHCREVIYMKDRMASANMQDLFQK